MVRTARRWGTAMAALLVAGVAASSLPASAQASGGSFGRESSRLSQGLARAVAGAGFDRLVDFDDPAGNGKAKPAAFLPNVDTAVIELSASGKVVGVANVLYDRDSPNGYQVRVDPASLATTGVQLSRWRLNRWDDPAAWAAGPDPADVLVQPTEVDKSYMVAYPASVLKVMVGYSVLRLVDAGALALDTPVTYEERGGRTCAYGPSNPTGVEPPPVADGATDTVAGWLDQMITVSDNFATCVLLQEIYDQGALDAANRHFAQIGLTSFRMQPSQPDVGNGWSSGTMTMGALDTTKLLLLVAGAPGRLWTAPDGSAVTADRGLSAGSRAAFLADLAEQSFNEVLNPVNLCGSTDAVQGIPSSVPQRWVDPVTGNVVTYDGDLVIDFGYDTRPCDAAAQVSFAHKTGLTSNAGGDAGIVRALPGQDGRWYLVASLTNVGYRFGDADWAKSKPNACEGAPYVCYPRAFGRLGAAVDSLVQARPAGVR
jgi:hypothetical protein